MGSKGVVKMDAGFLQHASRCLNTITSYVFTYRNWKYNIILNINMNRIYSSDGKPINC